MFDPVAVGTSMGGVDAVLHLATRIQPLEKMGQPEAWRENDLSNRRFTEAAGWRPQR
jgi:hypothetical protein